MGQLSPKKLHSDISEGRFKPIYYFFGSEDYRIGEAVRFVAGQFIPDRQVTTNFQRIDARKTKSGDLMAELSVFPMLGERQAFAVADLQSYKPKEIEKVLKLLLPPDPNRIVIFTTPSQRAPKKKSAFVKKMEAIAEVVRFGPLTPGQTKAMVDARLKTAELEIEPEALELLAGLVSGNRGALEMEMGKLTSFKQPGETVTREDIEQIASGYQVYSVFELANHVIAGDRAQALRMIHRTLAEGGSATGLLYFLSQHFISLYLVKAGKPLEPYRRWLESGFRTQAQRYELDRIGRIIGSIAKTDARLRRSRIQPELELDSLVLRIMSS